MLTFTGLISPDMDAKNMVAFMATLIENVARLVPVYLQQEEERRKAKGGIAICLIDPEGQVYGSMFGEDRIMARERYRVAWQKASQVWITGMPTGEFERKVFNKEVDESQFGIRRPDFIGWEGGQPLHLPDGTVLAAGFAGLTSASDLEIINKALQATLQQ